MPCFNKSPAPFVRVFPDEIPIPAPGDTNFLRFDYLREFTLLREFPLWEFPEKIRGLWVCRVGDALTSDGRIANYCAKSSSDPTLLARGIGLAAFELLPLAFQYAVFGSLDLLTWFWYGYSMRHPSFQGLDEGIIDLFYVTGKEYEKEDLPFLNHDDLHLVVC